MSEELQMPPERGEELQPPPLPPEPLPKGLHFKERVIFRILLSLPIVAGIIFAPDDWLRYVVALGFLVNFLSIEMIFAKLRNN
jgi:hypothetical protein